MVRSQIYMEYAFIIEFIIIILIVIFTYVLKFTHLILLKDEKRKLVTVRRILTNIIETKAIKKLDSLPKKFYRLDILMPLIKEFDKKKLGMNWQLIRKKIITSIVLPIAYKKIRAKQLRVRLLAIQGFDLTPEIVDKKIIKELLQDEIPLIRIFAANMAKKVGLVSFVKSQAENEQHSAIRVIYDQLLKNSKSEVTL